MKIIQKLFHKIIKESVKFQGCSSMHMRIAKDLDIPVFSVSVGIIKQYRRIEIEWKPGIYIQENGKKVPILEWKPWKNRRIE